MPNRIIREAILSSERMAKLTAAEEVLFRRLMSVVDDYGRFEGNTQLIRSRCYPLQIDDVKQADVIKWLAGCRRAGVLQLYAADGKEYLELFNFGQQIRSASKCPQPPSVDVPLLADASNCLETIGNAHLGVSVSEGVSVAHPPASGGKPSTFAKPQSVQQQTWDDYLKVRKAKKAPAMTATAMAGIEREVADAGIDLQRAIEVCCERNWVGFKAEWYTGQPGNVASINSSRKEFGRPGA